MPSDRRIKSLDSSSPLVVSSFIELGENLAGRKEFSGCLAAAMDEEDCWQSRNP